MDGVQPPLDNFLWIAGAEQPDATEDQIFAARLLNALYDKSRLATPDEVG